MKNFISKVTVDGKEYRLKCLEHQDGEISSDWSTLNDFGITDAYTKDLIDQKLIPYLTEEEGDALYQPKGNYQTKPTDISGKQDILNANLMKAVNSGITAAKVADYDQALLENANNVTEAVVENWGFTKNTGNYNKPTNGIPLSDLSLEVLLMILNTLESDLYAILDGKKADKATTLSGYGIEDANIVDNIITLGDLSITVITSDLLDTKQNTIADLDSIRAGVLKAFTAVQPELLKTINGESIIGKGDIAIQGGSGGYTKPTNGIPKSDLDLSVLNSLDKADSALLRADLSTYETSEHALLTYLLKGNYLTSDVLSGKIDTTEKGVANGVATLDANGKIPVSLLPSMLVDFTETEVNDLITFIYWAKNNNFGPWSETSDETSFLIYYGATLSVPTTEDAVKNGTKLDLNDVADIGSIEIVIPPGSKSLWIALPEGLGIKTWSDSTVKESKFYVTESNPITINEINYTLYHADAVIPQTNGSIINLSLK